MVKYFRGRVDERWFLGIYKVYKKVKIKDGKVKSKEDFFFLNGKRNKR